MRQEIYRKDRLRLSLVFVFILAASLAMWGCGSDSYDEPDATQTDSPLISAKTLKGWIDQGLVNDDESWEKVVILDLTDVAGYTAGHIPGAQLVTNGEVKETRQEGPSPTINMVLSGASMDDLIQAHGIDNRTTIVITGTSAPWVSRLYFVFRYWGFPKNRIKVLDGLWNAWSDAGYSETTAAPAIAETDFSVRDIGQLCPDLRVSLAELINFVYDGVGIAVDARGDKSAAGSTAGVFAPTGDYVVFEGTIKGGISDDTLAQSNYTDGNGYFLSASALRTLFQTAGVDGSETVYGYCRTGIWASAVFFVVDAILDWPVMLYDGSWSQWGKMSEINTGKDGELPPYASLWAVDNATYMDIVNYNVDVPYTIEELDPQELGDANAMATYPDPFQVDSDGKLVANQIENEDAAYLVSGGAPTAGGGDAGGGC